jgi:hypothetical protein
MASSAEAASRHRRPGLKAFDGENRRLKKPLAEAILDDAMLKNIAAENPGGEGLVRHHFRSSSEIGPDPRLNPASDAGIIPPLPEPSGARHRYASRLLKQGRIRRAAAGFEHRFALTSGFAAAPAGRGPRRREPGAETSSVS